MFIVNNKMEEDMEIDKDILKEIMEIDREILKAVMNGPTNYSNRNYKATVKGLTQCMKNHELIITKFAWIQTLEGSHYWQKIWQNGHTLESIQKLKAMKMMIAFNPSQSQDE